MTLNDIERTRRAISLRVAERLIGTQTAAARRGNRGEKRIDIVGLILWSPGGRTSCSVGGPVMEAPG